MGIFIIQTRLFQTPAWYGNLCNRCFLSSIYQCSWVNRKPTFVWNMLTFLWRFQVKQTKPLVHPLVDEAKSKGKVRTTPPKSPRSGRSPRMQPSASSPRQEVRVSPLSPPSSTKRIVCNVMRFEKHNQSTPQSARHAFMSNFCCECNGLQM